MNLPPCSSCSRTTGPPSPSRQRIRPVLPAVVLPLLGLTCCPFSSQLSTASAGTAAPRRTTARTCGARIAAIVPPAGAPPRTVRALEELLGNEPAEQHV